MKKLLVLTLAIVMLGVAACGTPAPAPAPAPAAPAPAAAGTEAPEPASENGSGIDGEIAVIVIGATHGFPVGVQWYANNKVEALRAEGHNAQLYVGETPEHQIQVVEQLLTRANELAGIVILPFDPTLQNAVQAIYDSGVPLVQFNRVIHEVPSAAKVVGDNFGIGFETARVFAERGITLEDRVLEMPGSNSSVVETRSEGFRAGLVEFMGWDRADVEAMITRTDFTMWNRDTSRQLFESFVGTTSQDQLDRYRFVFTQDDEIAIGVFNAITAGNLPGDVSAIEVVGASAGKQEMYIMLRDGVWDDQFYVFSLTHPPVMIVESIEVLMRALGGETFPDEPIFTPTTLVDRSNAANFINPDSPY